MASRRGQRRDLREGGDKILREGRGRSQGAEILEGGSRVSGEKGQFREGILRQPWYELFPLPRLPQLSAAIALVGGINQQLQERKAEALAQISAAFEDLEQALQQRKQALVSDLEAICGAKQKVCPLTLSHHRPA